MRTSKLHFALLLGLALPLAAPPPILAAPADAAAQEARLIAVLESGATQKEKADACRELAHLGTKAAVPALAALLGDEKLSHMARYGLEPNPDPSVDAALREALGKLQGRLLAGVIGSLGVRRDTAAVEPLTRLLRDADADVAQAAARALGRIGTPEAAQALQAALPGVAPGNQVAFCEGLFRCAEALAARGRASQAQAIYDQLLQPQLPHQVRTAAVRGAIVSRGPEGAVVLRARLRSQDYVMFAGAVRAAQEVPGALITQALTAELPQLPADQQIVVLQTLGKGGDASAVLAVSTAARSGPKPVRLAAIHALAEIGHASATPALTELMRDSDREIAQAAQESFASLPGRDIDVAVMRMLDSADAGERLAGIELIGRRRMTSATPALLKAAGDTDGKVRSAAMKRLGELGGPADLSAVLDLLMKARASSDLDAAEQAAGTLGTRLDNPDATAGTVAGRMAAADAAQKRALLRVLSTIGGGTALKAVRAAVNDSTPEVRAAAIRALGDWKTADAAPDLLALAKEATNPTDRALCLRAYLTLAADQDIPAGQRLSMCRQASALTEKAEEKKLLLAALGGINHVEAVGMVTPHLEDASTREEAATAVLSIADRLLKGQNAAKVAPRLIEPLQKVSEATTNADRAKRAKTLLQQAQSKAGPK